jgi:hypothetical protein
LPTAGFAKKKIEVPTLRWEQGAAGCSVDKAGTDRFYHYSIVNNAVQISLAVDPQELTQSQKRAGRVMGVLLTVHNNNPAAPVVIKPSDATLEFIQHYHWQFPAWEPGELSYHIQNTTDDLMHQTDKDLEKRPDKVESNEERLREHQRLVSEMVEFLSTQSLRETALDAATPDASGWIFFPSRGKWVGGWKKREEFVLRIPVGSWVVEFPFVLPPNDRPSLKERPD